MPLSQRPKLAASGFVTFERSGGWPSEKGTLHNLGGIRYRVGRVCAKFFSFRNCGVNLVGSESYLVSNYSQYYYQEKQRGIIKLINFSPKLLFLVCSNSSPIARER